MSVVHKSIDLDFLAGELRKHGNVLSRCENCGRLFTDVQTAILHRKVHSSVTILLPRASDKNKHESQERDKDPGPTAAVTSSAVSDGGGSQDGVQCDYRFIMEAIANANETMTFADLEKISSKMLQIRKHDSSLEFDSTCNASSEKDPCSSFPYKDTQSFNSNSIGSQGLHNKLPSTSSLEKDPRSVFPYEDTQSSNSNSIGSQGLHNKHPSTSSLEKDPRSVFLYEDIQSSNVNTVRSHGLLNKPPDTSQAEVHASAGHKHESLDRTCDTLQSFSSCKTTGSKDPTNSIYNNGVKVRTDSMAVETDHEVALQNQTDADGDDQPNREYLAMCGSTAVLDDLDFGSAIFVGEVTGPQSFVSERRHHQLVQQLMGGSSFLQLLNEPLDESFDALYNTSCCNANNNSLSIESPYVENSKPNTSLVNQSDNCVNNLSETSTRSNPVMLVDGSNDICGNNNVSLTSHPFSGSKMDQKTVESVDGSKYVCGFRNNVPIRSQAKTSHKVSNPSTHSEMDLISTTSCKVSNPTIDSKMDLITTTSCKVSNPSTDSEVDLISTTSHKVLNDTCGMSNSKSRTKCPSSVQLNKNHSMVSTSQGPNAICHLTKTKSAENVTTEVVSDGDDIQILETTFNKPCLNSYSIHKKAATNSTDKKITTSRDASLSKEHASKVVISVSLLPCSHCSLKFQTFLLLVDHMTTNHNMVISKCSKCGQIFYDADAVKKHLLIHKPIVPLGPRNSTKRFGRFVQKCQVCGLEFGNLQMFKNHMLSHPYPFIFSPESLSNPSDEKLNVEELGSVDCDMLSDSTNTSNVKEHANIDCDSLSNNMFNKEDSKKKTVRGKNKRKKSKMVFDKDEDSLDLEVIFEDEDGDLLSDNTNVSNKEDGKKKTVHGKRKKTKSKMAFHKDKDSRDPVIFNQEDDEGDSLSDNTNVSNKEVDKNKTVHGKKKRMKRMKSKTVFHKDKDSQDPEVLFDDEDEEGDSLSDNTNMSNKEDGEKKIVCGKNKRKKSKMVFHKDEDSLDPEMISDDEDGDLLSDNTSVSNKEVDKNITVHGKKKRMKLKTLLHKDKNSQDPEVIFDEEGDSLSDNTNMSNKEDGEKKTVRGKNKRKKSKMVFHKDEDSHDPVFDDDDDDGVRRRLRSSKKSKVVQVVGFHGNDR